MNFELEEKKWRNPDRVAALILRTAAFINLFPGDLVNRAGGTGAANVFCVSPSELPSPQRPGIISEKSSP
jgi:hypothetical protein